MFKHTCFPTSDALLKKRKSISKLEGKNGNAVLSNMSVNYISLAREETITQLGTGILTVKCLCLYYNKLYLHQHHFSLQNLPISFNIMLMLMSSVA